MPHTCTGSATAGTFKDRLNVAAAAQATEAGGSGAGGTAGAGYYATSTTSLAIGTGSKTFTTQTGLAYSAGARARAASASDPTKFMEGLVTSYSGSTLVINVDTVGGSGTYADWNINLAGLPGTAGSTGATGAQGPSTYALRATFINAGSAIVAGDANVVYLEVPVTGTIDEWSIGTIGGVGSCQLDIWRDVYANFPPTVADTITAGNKPNVATGIKGKDTTLTGWSKSVTAGDWIAVYLETSSAFTVIYFTLRIAVP